MSTGMLYLLLKMDAIRGCFIALFFMLLVFCICSCIGTAFCCEILDKEFIEKLKKFKLSLLFIGAFLFFLIGKMLPTTKQMAILIVVPKVINVVENSETLKMIPSKVLKLADEWIEELSPKMEEE